MEAATNSLLAGRIQLTGLRFEAHVATPRHRARRKGSIGVRRVPLPPRDAQPSLEGGRRGTGARSEDGQAVPVFFLSDSTGISAETMGNALLIQFPDPGSAANRCCGACLWVKSLVSGLGSGDAVGVA